MNVVPNEELVRPAEPKGQTAPDYSPGFDEEGFGRKQELARAALVRLQQSLNEEFVTPPRETRKTQPRTNGVGGHTKSNTSNDGRPWAPPPSSIFAQVRDSRRPVTSQINGYPEPRETSRPRAALSVHELVTKPRSKSPPSTAMMKPILSQAPPGPEFWDAPKRSSKGEEKELSTHLTEMQRLAYEMKATKLAMPSNPSQQRIYEDAVSPLPRSPGEISLSSFPVPTPSHSRQPSTISNNASVTGQPRQHQHQHTGSTFSSFSRAAAAPSPVVSPTPESPDKQQRYMLTRRGSTKSEGSAMTSTSQHSIPYHLIPDRGSSMGDSLVREDELET